MDDKQNPDRISPSLQETEETGARRQAEAGGKRITLADLEAEILMRHDFNLGDALKAVDTLYPEQETTPLTMMVCVLVMKNGFIVIDKSAPTDPTNFDPGVAKKFAYEGCIRQLWPLFAFREKSKVADVG